MMANSKPGAQTVMIPEGVHALAIPRHILPFDSDPRRGDIEITDELRIVGTGADSSILDGGAVDRTLEVIGSFNVDILDLTIRNGMTDEGGGAILNAFANLTLTDVDLIDNTSGGGGALYNVQSGFVTMRGVRMEGNLASGGFGNGGAVLNLAQDKVLMLDSSMVNNTALLSGGAVYTNSALELTNTSIDGNGAGKHGGGIATFGEIASLTVTKSVVSNNVAGETGGGVDLSSAYPGHPVATIIDTTIAGNAAEHGGGVDAAAPIVVESSTISGNYAPNGGGVRNTSNLQITNSTISGNSASAAGGGILNDGPQSEASLTNVTLALNRIDDPAGAAISSAPDAAAGVHARSGQLTFADSIVAGNIGGNCLIGPEAVAFYVGNSIEDSSSSCGFSTPPADPLLQPLDDNRGPTQTHALQPDSPAIDGVLGECLTGLDQRGAPRPFDGDANQSAYCDIGAFEFGASVPAPSPTPHPAESVLWADNDCDDAINATDALTSLRYVSALPYGQTQPCFAIGSAIGIAPAGVGELTWGDIDCDGDVDSADALAVLQSIAAHPVNQRPGCPQIEASILIVPH